MKDADTKSISWATINIHEKVAKLPSEHLPRRLIHYLFFSIYRNSTYLTYFFWVSSLAYPNLLGKKGYVVVVVVVVVQHIEVLVGIAIVLL